MRRPVLMVSAAATLSVAVLAASTGIAAADGVTPPTPALPTVTVTLPPLPVPTPTVSLPVPAPTPTVPGLPGGGSGGSGGGGGNPTSGTPTAGATGDSTRVTSGATGATAAGKHNKHASTVEPMVVGRPGARDALDDESTPALTKASKAFLKADTKIAALTEARARMLAARDGAARAAAAYAALQTKASAARAASSVLHQRSDRLDHMIIINAVRSYQTGHAAGDDASTHDLMAASTSAREATARGDAQLDAIVAAANRAEADAARLSAEYTAAQQSLRNIDQRLAALAAQRSTALTAAQAAKSGDVARHRQTLAESGQLGAEIRSASAQLAAAGRTVQGSGEFIHPSAGFITSPYGMRMHPILHYVKLHTGTDFAVGDGFAHAADSGRVLFTIISVAYGNFTVIDHGTINGRHITTAYAHQAKFLVKPGDVVTKGQKIGIIGATGYATGPHLHFEVRDDGAVENPMTWLTN
jgi:murein DD-endopeptidase MepM/ murein hydrolase activator NlpD